MQYSLEQRMTSFLSEHFFRYKEVAYQQQGKWKFVKEYVKDNKNYYDFNNPFVGDVVLNEKLEIISQPEKYPKLKPTLMALSGCFYESRGNALIKRSVDKTVSSIASGCDVIKLIGEGDATDDNGNPVYAYYYEIDRRNLTLLVYPDNSWGSNSD